MVCSDVLFLFTIGVNKIPVNPLLLFIVIDVLPFMPTFVVFVLSFVSRRVSTKLPPALLRPYFPGKFVKVG